MRILFLDTETNGLPKNRFASYTMTAAWPALAQVAWQVWDFQQIPPLTPIPIAESSLLVQPAEGTAWSAEAAAIHGITEAVARSEGWPVDRVLLALAEDAADCDMVVAHNLGFDKPVLWAAAHKAGMHPADWWPKKELCTMLETVGYCKIPSTSKFATAKDPYKWPKLAEVWQTLYPTSPVPANLHNARNDVALLVSCFTELVQRLIITLPAGHVVSAGTRSVDLLRRLFTILRI